MAETHYCKSRWMQEHPWLDRLYVKLALQVKKRTKNKKVSNTWTQNEEKKPKSVKAGRADTSNPLWWVGMQMDYEIIKKLNLRAGFYSSLWQAKAKRKTEGAELLNTQPHQLVKVTVCNHTVAGVFKLPFFFFPECAWLRCMVAGVRFGLLYTGTLAEGRVPSLYPNSASQTWAPWCLPALQHISFQTQVRSFRHQQNPVFTGCWARP